MPRSKPSTYQAARVDAQAQRGARYRKRCVVPASLIAVLVITVLAGCGSDTTSSTSGAAPAASSAAGTAAAPTESKAATASSGGGQAPPIQDGDWRMDSVKLKDDGLGDFGGTARITYTGQDENGGSNLFTITVFKKAKDIAAMNGSASDVKPGDTVTVQLISSDKYVRGPYTYDFQNDI